MKRSQMFVKTSKNAPSDEVSKNAQLLIRAGFVYKEMAGVYAYLPLGLKVLENIKQVIREEMNQIGGEEVSLTALQNQEVWQKTGRWSDDVVDVWFKTKLANGSELGLAPTHEEPLTQLMKGYVASYKDLPQYVYQFQTKFRNELRAKSGIMRGREFLMKDLYSFNRNESDQQEFYESATKAYHKVFERLGLGDSTYKTFASGGSFSKYSHEFQTICDAGEDIVYIDDKSGIAINEEVLNDEVLADLNLKRDDLREAKTAEVGNIFTLGTKFSDALGLHYTDDDGKIKPVFMGSYGIGPTRVMGVIVEKMADGKGIVWPENIAPARVYLINIGNNEKVIDKTSGLYDELVAKGIDVIWDDRDVRPGDKFADADLIGIPFRVVISEKMADDEFEIKERKSNDVDVVNKADLVKRLSGTLDIAF